MEARDLAQETPSEDGTEGILAEETVDPTAQEGPAHETAPGQLTSQTDQEVVGNHSDSEDEQDIAARCKTMFWRRLRGELPVRTLDLRAGRRSITGISLLRRLLVWRPDLQRA